MKKFERTLFVLFSCVAIVVAVVLIARMRGGDGNAALALAEQPYVEQVEPIPEIPLPPPAPEQIFLEYIPAQITPQEQLAATITYAQNRYENAEVRGANIQLGRHNAADMAALSQAIEAAQAVLDSDPAEDVATKAADELHDNTRAFKSAKIDPDNFYRPFANEIAIGEDVPQKHHLRGAWIATVLNIDWPSAAARGTTPAHVDMQMEELRARFDEIAAIGYNAVIFQISPTGDAFYRSQISPWSAWLTGETKFTGVLRDSTGAEFDPLEYAISLARARNIEFHAWFNPYRITHTIGNYTRGDGIILSSTGNRVTRLQEIRQEWEQIPGTAFYLFGDYVKIGEERYVVDPAAPGVRDWIVRRVLEVLENYDIDAVHFDDYFYPSGYNINDTFARYNTPEHNLLSGITHPDTPQGRADWRRENTEMMIRDVSAAIRQTAPWVKFGISPGGVWKSSPGGNTGFCGGGYDAGTGSASTTSWSNYHSSFADTRNWVIENLIDYLTPQVYWEWTLPAAPYGIISEWWGRLFFDFGSDGDLRNSQGEYTTAHLYIGMGLYRMLDTPPAKWRNAPGFENEGTRTFLRQEAYALGNTNIHGTMTFSQNQMRPGRENGMWETMETLRDTLWRYPALVSPMPHMGGTAPAPPQNVTVTDSIITWENAETSTCPLVAPRYFVIYRNQNPSFDINNPANIFAIVPAVDETRSYVFEVHGYTGEYYYAVTAVNRLHDESLAVVGRRQG